MSFSRLQLEQHMLREEADAAELRLSLEAPADIKTVPVTRVMVPSEPEPTAHDECADLLVSWWRSRAPVPVTMAQIKELARRMRLRGRAR